MSEELSERMKAYEFEARYYLPQRTYTIVRVDGKCFHTWTRGMQKPFDFLLSKRMDRAAIELCSEMMGIRLAYGQSDEYSFLLTDFEIPKSEAWFGGCVQKMASVAASMFTATFNYWEDGDPGHFDARVFTLPTREEVVNYFIWRQLDAIRNSVSMVAECHFSPNQCYGKGVEERLEMLKEKGLDWELYPTADRYGRVVRKEKRERDVSWTHKRTGMLTTQRIWETYWEVDKEIPRFVEQREYLLGMVPELREGA